MTEVDRDIALALFKCLRKRRMITDETYVSAVSSRFFDKRHFTSDTGAISKRSVEEVIADVDNQMASGTDAAGKVYL